MRLCVLLGLAALVLFGCGSRTHSDPVGGRAAAAETPADPAERLHSQLHSAAYQLSNALDSLKASKDAADKLRKMAGATSEIKQGMADLADFVNDAGDSIGDYSEEPDDVAAIRADMKKAGKARQSAIDGCNDALHDLYEAEGIVGDLSDGAPGSLQNPFEAVDGSLDEAGDAILGALQALGGKEEKEDASD